MRDRMFSSTRVPALEDPRCRRCRGATRSQGPTGLRGPVAMGSRDTRSGRSGLNFSFLNIDRDRACLIRLRRVIIHAAWFPLLRFFVAASASRARQSDFTAVILDAFSMNDFSILYFSAILLRFYGHCNPFVCRVSMGYKEGCLDSLGLVKINLTIGSPLRNELGFM